MKRGLVRWGLVVLLVAPLSLLLVPANRNRLHAAWLARGLRSESYDERSEARLRLLELGRPAIDHVLPDLLASEIADEVGRNCMTRGYELVSSEELVVLGEVLQPLIFPVDNPGFELRVDRVLVGKSGPTVKAELRECKIAKPLEAVRLGRGRKLFVISTWHLRRNQTRTVVRLALELDDELERLVEEALRERLSR